MKLRFIPLLLVLPALYWTAYGQNPAANATPTPAVAKRTPQRIGTAVPGKAAKKASAAVQQALNKPPAGAKQIDDSSWEYTDAQSKVWIYRKSPFGLMRMEKVQTAAPAAASDSNSTPAN